MNGKQILKVTSDNKNMFVLVIALILVFTFGMLPLLNKGSYSTDDTGVNEDILTIECPEKISSNGQLECSVSLVSDSIITQGLSFKYNLTEGLEFSEFETTDFEVYNNDEDGSVLVNLNGVSGKVKVGDVKFNLPTTAMSNSEYTVELVDITIGDGEDKVITLENASDKVRIESDINTLDSLSLNFGKLNEEFNKDKNEYTATVDSDNIIINYTKTDKNSIVTGDVGDVNLHYGTNNLSIVVTSESGIKNTYKISVYIEYKFSTDVYLYNETDNYMYTGNDNDVNVSLGKVTIADGLNKEIKDNKLIISYGEEILKEIDLAFISSSVYALSNDYIYTSVDKFDVSNITAVNVDKYFDGDTLLISFGNTILKRYTIASIDFGDLIVSNNIISLKENMSFYDFVNSVKVNNVSYKILNNNQEVTGGYVYNGMKLITYYNNVELETFDISIYNLEFDNSITIDETNKFILYLEKGSTVESLINKINAITYMVEIYNNDNEKKNQNDVLATGDVLKIYSGDDIFKQYTLSVIGDSNGDGYLDLIDLVQMRKHIVGWVNPSTGEVQRKIGVYYYALDFNKDNVIDLIDLVRMRKAIVGLI